MTVAARPLPAQQARVLAFIREHTAQHGYPPTIAEIERAMGWRSPTFVVQTLKRLCQLGHLVAGPERSSRRYAPADAITRPTAPGDGADLTARQVLVWRAICAAIERDGVPPSVREIGQACGITSPNGVLCHLAALERKGYVRRGESQGRAIEVLKVPVEG